MSRRPILAGNWKLNKGTPDEAATLAAEVVAAVAGTTHADVVLCVPYTVLSTVVATTDDSVVAVGAQDAFWKESGAYTGQVSPGMLKAVGVRYVILGHSETRGRYGVAEPDFTDVVLAHFGESDETVNRKTKAVLAQGLVLYSRYQQLYRRCTFAAVDQVDLLRGCRRAGQLCCGLRRQQGNRTTTRAHSALG